MAYCPECGAEFGGGIRRCPECLVDLLDELEEPSLYDSQEENLVLIRETASFDEAKEIKELLGRNGILCVIDTAKVTRGQAGPDTTHVLVNQKDASRCQELLKQKLG
jgi:hypothetical protein